MAGTKKSALLAGGLLLLPSTNAFAQNAPVAVTEQDAPGPIELSEIVVTAQRRSENLQDVPISVSALSGEALEAQRITQPSDLISFVPNLQIVSAAGQGTPIFALRGVTMADYSLNQSAPVATYIDEVYKSNFAQLGVSLFDLERIEVLRGPQGTLYGKNTTGGAVNLISRVPGDDFGGYLEAEYGNYDRVAANGAVQAPLGPELSARIAFTYTRVGGFLKNLFPGEPDNNAVREYGVRGTLKFEPSKDFRAILRVSTGKRDPNGLGVIATPGPDGVGHGVYTLFNGLFPASNPNLDYFRAGLGRYEIESNYTERRVNRATTASLTVDWKLNDALKLTSVSSYDYGKLFDPQNTDGSPLETLEIDYTDRAETWAQDLRLASDFDGPLNFLFGLYYNDEKVFNGTELRFFQDVDLNGDAVLDFQDCADSFTIDGLHGVGCKLRNSFDQRKRSYAAYSDFTFEPSEKWTFHAGLRFTHDTGRQSNFISQLIGSDDIVLGNLIPGSPTDLNATTSRDFRQDNLSGRVGIDYHITPDAMLYGSYSRGYRGRAFNAQAFFDPSELAVVPAEKIDSVEIGFKSSLFDRRVRLNGALFHYIYANQQFIDIDPVTSSQTLLSIPKSRIQGLELELVARPIKRLTLTGGLGLLSTKIKKGEVQGEDVAGNRLANAPSLSLTAAVDLDVYEADWGRIALHVDQSYASGQFFELQNKPRLRQPGYSLVNARLALIGDDDRWQVAVWGKNLFNKYYTTSRLDISGFGLDWNLLGDPRTYGVSLKYRF